MNSRARTIEELHHHLPKIVLTKLSREPFKRTTGLIGFGRSEATSA
jgi:hypothetical protein